MSVSGCDCCEGFDRCPGLAVPFTLLTWRGGRTIDSDLRTLPLWQSRHLDRYHKSNLMWQVVLANTGNISAGTRMCLTQGTDVYSPFVAPTPFGFLPLNVGTLWQGRLRNGYGDSDFRAIRLRGGPSSVCDDTTADDDQILAQADFATAGTNSIVVYDFSSFSNQLEFQLQLVCLGCHFGFDVSLWEMYEHRDLIYLRPEGGYSNVPAIEHFHFAPDCFDAHLRNEEFPINNITEPRKPPCPPDIVLLGDGQYIKTDFTGTIIPILNLPRGFDVRFDQPTAHIQRLKEIYGTKFSYWGGWIKPGLNPIQTRLSEYDLSQVKVLFLGGMHIGDVSSGNPDGWTLKNAPFAAGELQPLIDWLDAGDHLLVCDGGVWPEEFWSALGLTSTVENFGAPTTIPSLNGDPVYGPLGNVGPPVFQRLYLEPQTHPFTEGVIDLWNYWDISLANITQVLPTFPGTDVEQYTTNVPVVTPGTDAVVIGRIKGELPTPPNPVSSPVGPVDYPGIVVEPWAGNPTSRVVVHQFCDLLPPDNWGTGWDSHGGTPYAWGLGLSHRASETFLRNLWDRRNDF